MHLADLRGLDLRRIDQSGAYLRTKDLRGVGRSQANLEGVSIHEEQISSTLFPENLSTEEIMLSVTHRCRMRVIKTVEI